MAGGFERTSLSRALLLALLALAPRATDGGGFLSLVRAVGGDADSRLRAGVTGLAGQT